jgi:ferredoxin
MEKKLILSFPPESTYNPVMYSLVKEYDIRINIIKAEIEIGKGGQMLAVLDADVPESIDRAIHYLKECGIAVSSLANKVFYDEAACTSCGSCASSCPSGALAICAPDWKLRFEPEHCIICKLCLVSCPLKLFSIEFAE